MLIFNESNEEDVTTQFKVKRNTKEFGTIVFDRVKIVFAGGELKLDFDWTGIRRIQIEAADRAEKLAGTEKAKEETKLVKEKQLAEKKRLEEIQKLDDERKKREAAEMERQRQELLKKTEAKKDKEESDKRKKAFEDKVINAMKNGPDAAPTSHKTDKTDSGGEESGKDEHLGDNVSKHWSEEHQAFYYMQDETNELSWRDPSIHSIWEKNWDADKKAFVFRDKMMGGETRDSEPWQTRFECIHVPEHDKFYYVDRVTGDTQAHEPYY